MSRPISSESKFRAIAHITRRGIIDLLLRDPHTPSELLKHFRHSRGVLSKHLRILETVGLVEFSRRGTELVYRLVPREFDSLHQWMDRLPRRTRGPGN